MKIGFVKECLELLALLNIKEDEILDHTKISWKKLMSVKLKQKNRKDLLNLIKKYEKIDYFARKEEEYEIKGYFKNMTIENCRVMFGLRNKMTRTIQTHYSSDKGYEKEL